MKYLLLVLLLVGCFTGCSEALRTPGEPFEGYSCRESLIHYYSNCSSEQLSEEKLNSMVQSCEEKLATKICDKEQAALLWCMGRVAPGTYTRGGGVGIPIGRGAFISSGQSNTTDGCDCSTFEGDLKECRMKNGIFD